MKPALRPDLSQAFEEVPPPPPMPRVPGTLPEDIRYKVKNPDGSISTVDTISIGTDDGEVLIPTVVAGKHLTPAEAEAHFRATGEHFGIFDTPEAATAYAEDLHQRHAKMLRKRP